MAVNVRIPTTMRPIAGGAASVQVEGVTLSDVLANLETAHPGFRERLFDDDGALRKFVNVFVADDDVRYLDGRHQGARRRDRQHHPRRRRRLIELVFE